MVATKNQISVKCHSNLLLSFNVISNTLIVNSTPSFLLCSLMRLHICSSSAKMRVYAVISYGFSPWPGSCRHLMFSHAYSATSCLLLGTVVCNSTCNTMTRVLMCYDSHSSNCLGNNRYFPSYDVYILLRQCMQLLYYDLLLIMSGLDFGNNALTNFYCIS